jgi:hypothetical protein
VQRGATAATAALLIGNREAQAVVGGPGPGEQDLLGGGEWVNYMTTVTGAKEILRTKNCTSEAVLGGKQAEGVTKAFSEVVGR